MTAIASCRTAVLGGHVEQRARCGHTRVWYSSCDRRCLKCQSLATATWLEARRAELLPVNYFHTVFTAPHVLNPLILVNKACRYQILWIGTATSAARATMTRTAGQTACRCCTSRIDV